MLYLLQQYAVIRMRVCMLYAARVRVTQVRAYHRTILRVNKQIVINKPVNHLLQSHPTPPPRTYHKPCCISL